MLPMLDEFRTVDWSKIKRELDESAVSGGFQELVFHN